MSGRFSPILSKFYSHEYILFSAQADPNWELRLPYTAFQLSDLYRDKQGT